MSSSYSSLPSTSSARGWVDRISSIFRKEISIHIDHLPPVSVFEVPKVFSVQKPEAYTPQLIALGPYHHLRSDLYQMERYKLAGIKEISTPEQIFNFQQLVINKLKEIDPWTRSCYNKFMDYDQDTLAWIMAIDGCFLLSLMTAYLDHSDNATDKALLDNTIITRDLMMLENQIPFIHLKEIRRVLHLSSPDDVEDLELFWMLLELCEAHSPVKFHVDKTRCINTTPHHFLDLMYHLIVSGPAYVPNPIEDGPPISKYPTNADFKSSSSLSSSSSDEGTDAKAAVHENVEAILEVVDSLGNKRTQAILKPVQVISNIPWSTISGLFRTGTLSHGATNSPDQEIRIPTVSHLWRHADVKCYPIAGGINDIRFDEKKATLYLPVLNLNASSEVIMRNLVAYEAAISKTTLEFARYVNLMNGIIDTEEDVKLLRQNGVIKGALSDSEIAELFNGMKKSYVRSDGMSNTETAIKEVNKYYDKKVVVRILRQLKKHFYASWRALALVSTILLMIVLSVQSFCDIYACSRFWGGK